MVNKQIDSQKLGEYLSPIEKKVLPFLKEDINAIIEKSFLDKTSVLRALDFLAEKNIILLQTKKESVIVLGINGIMYIRHGLPERKLLAVLAEKKVIPLKNAKELAHLTDDELKASIGVLKKKAFITITQGNIALIAKKEEIMHKTLEEKFLDNLPKKFNQLAPEEKYAFENLKERRNIIEIEEEKSIVIHITPLAEKLMREKFDEELLESITPELIKSNVWKQKKFRRYNLQAVVSKIFGGKRHFVNQAIDYAKKIWLEMGFIEMGGNIIQSGFWNFDALFTAQDHPVREMQDTFFINKEAKLPDRKFVQQIKNAHEGKISASKGWQYCWKESDAKKVVLRTHTTCLSIQTLKKIAENGEFPAKYFALGKCFRNETIDWSHGFEFNQSEGIVVDENANFKQLLGYLTEFFNKMGYEKIRIRPGYFPYTEPSLEIDVFHPHHKKWVELGGAGMFRPEITIPIFGKHVPVLAWGPGFDRIIMEFFNITDLRDMYKNELNQLREMKIWNK